MMLSQCKAVAAALTIRDSTEAARLEACCATKQAAEIVVKGALAEADRRERLKRPAAEAPELARDASER